MASVRSKSHISSNSFKVYEKDSSLLSNTMVGAAKAGVV